MEEGARSEWDRGKDAHRRLSDTVADRYDDLYEFANFATGSYMRYELETIVRVSATAPSAAVAADLGCGTGRDAFVLAKRFDQVYGYDISPGMVENANRNKLERRTGNVLFEVLDLDAERLPHGDEAVDLVNSGFGMASFVFSPETLFREVRRVLRPKGVAIFSFYNSDALVNSLTLEWKPALSARPLLGRDLLRVEFAGECHDLSARAYSPKDIKNRLDQFFNVVEILTYPTLTALFPQSLFTSDKAKALCTRVDHLLAGNSDLAAGPYIVGICQKRGNALRERPSLGYARVLQLLERHDIKPEIRSHGPVRNMNDVRGVLNVPPSEMAKSVLVAVDFKTDAGPDYPELYLVAVPADRKLDLGALARLLFKRRDCMRLATQVEVEELTGFQFGSIPPFGLPKDVPVIVDSRLATLEKIWCGTGKETESLRISIDELKRLATFTDADVSKPIPDPT